MSKVNFFAQGLGLKPLSADPTGPVDGQLYMSDGTARAAGLWRYSSTSVAWLAVGSGGGGLDVFHTEDFESNGASDFTTGNAATVDAAGTGTLDGTLADETSAPFSADASLKYTMGSTSANDFFLQDADIDIELKQTSNDVGVSFYYTYNGDDSDLRFFALDQDDAELTDSIDYLEAASTPTRFSTSFYIPAGTTGIRYGFQVVTGNSAKIFIVDDIELSLNPFVYKNLVDPRAVVIAAGNGGESITADVTDIPFTEVEDELGLWDGDSFTAAEDGDYLITGNIGFTAAKSGVVSMYVDGSSAKRIGRANSDGDVLFVVNQHLSASDVVTIRFSASGTLINSTTNHHIHIQKIPESTEHVVTPAKSNINNFSALIANNGTATITSQGGVNASGQNAIASVNQTGTGNVDIVFTSGFFTEKPTAIVTMNDSLNRYLAVTVLSTTGCTVECRDDGGVFRDNNFSIQFSRQGADTKEAQFLAAIPVQKVAYIKDVKANNVEGGTYTTGGAWQTRDLNTVEGDSSFVSVSANQFTLSPGLYSVSGSAPAYKVDRHQAKLYDVTNSQDSLIGAAGYTDNTAGSDAVNNSFIEGELVVTASTTFEVRHIGELAYVTFGMGVASPAATTNTETYTQLKITKLR